jgi:hypothetical protein
VGVDLCKVEGETCSSDGKPSPTKSICTTAEDRR